MSSLKMLERVALAIFDCGAFRDKTHSSAVEHNGQRGFKLKLHEKQPDAPLSPLYLNLRTPDNPKPGPLTSEIIADCATLMRQLVFLDKLDCVCGLPNAGDPLALAYLCIERSACKPVTLLRLGKEQRGEQRRIVGPPRGQFQPGSWVTILDDLITEADSKFEGIDANEQAGLKIANILVIVDRQQGGAEMLKNRGYKLHALFTLEHLLEIYRDHSRISVELQQEILAYIKK